MVAIWEIELLVRFFLRGKKIHYGIAILSFILLFHSISFSDLIDIVKEQLHGNDYVEDEDPKLYISYKTKRGPLSEDWLEDYWNEVNYSNKMFLFSGN